MAPFQHTAQHRRQLTDALLGLAALLLVLCAPAVAAAQDPAAPQQSAAIAPPAAGDIPDFLRPLPGWDGALDRIEKLVSEPSATDRTLADARRDVTQVENELKSYLRRLRPRLGAARAQAERLGPAPTPGHPETSTITQQRNSLASTVTDLSGAVNAAEAALLRAEHLSERIRDVRRAAFQENVLQRGPSALSPELWTQVSEDISTGLSRLQLVLSDWQGVPDQGRFLRLVMAAIIFGAGLSYAAHRGILRYRLWHEPQPPPEWHRVASAGWVIVLRALPTLVASGFLFVGITAWNPLPARLTGVIEAALLAFVTVMMVRAVSKTVLALRRPHWRLLHLSDEAARKLNTRVLLLATVYGADQIASALNEAANVPFSLNVAQSFVSSILYASLIISILLIRAPAYESGRSATRVMPFYVQLPLWLVAIAILVAALIGYVALARFIAGQLIVISTILTATYLFLVWASAFGKSLSDDRTPPGRWLQERLGLGKRRREQIALPIELLLQTAILVAAIPFLLLQWGFDRQDVADLFTRVLFGFQIGQTRISVLGLIAALLVFIVGYIVAKIVQGWLDSDVLEPAGVETSVRQSIRTGVGYLGIALAAVVALSYAGLDISNLAIVAGALSVGIGFGLQSVVNNFVSGLILLAERPIKVGDWIIVGGDEGIVRRISVRSTEIETFERSSVIVPNAMLISEKVKNWTLHNLTGRYAIKVGVHYNSDPEQVRDLLLGLARAHPDVLNVPEPFVYFEEFGSSSLNFSLYVYLTNVSRSFAVRTDLRMGIIKAFRAAGIEMPYPQADIHFRDLQWVKQAITERLAKPKQGEMTVRGYEAESGLADNDDGNGE